MWIERFDGTSVTSAHLVRRLFVWTPIQESRTGFGCAIEANRDTWRSLSRLRVRGVEPGAFGLGAMGTAKKSLSRDVLAESLSQTLHGTGIFIHTLALGALLRGWRYFGGHGT